MNTRSVNTLVEIGIKLMGYWRFVLRPPVTGGEQYVTGAILASISTATHYGCSYLYSRGQRWLSSGLQHHWRAVVNGGGGRKTVGNHACSATLHFFMGGLNGGYLNGIPPRPPQARPRNSNVNSVLDAAVPLSLDLLYFSSTSWSCGADVVVTSGRDSSRLLTK